MSAFHIPEHVCHCDICGEYFDKKELKKDMKRLLGETILAEETELNLLFGDGSGRDFIELSAKDYAKIIEAFIKKVDKL